MQRGSNGIREDSGGLASPTERKDLCDWIVMARNIPEIIGMIRHILVVGFRTALRMMLIAAALADAVPATGTRVEAA